MTGSAFLSRKEMVQPEAGAVGDGAGCFVPVMVNGRGGQGGCPPFAEFMYTRDVQQSVPIAPGQTGQAGFFGICRLLG
jgi:hypothetical protein